MWGHRCPCFGILVMSAFGYKARVDPLSCVHHRQHAAESSESPLVRHLLSSWQPAWQPDSSNQRTWNIYLCFKCELNYDQLLKWEFHFVGPLFWTSDDVCQGFKARVDSITSLVYHFCATDYSDSPLVRHLMTSWHPAWQQSNFNSVTCVQALVGLEAFFADFT